ncbi:TMhelix containing protein [Vibrio phage 1.238.A._10N.261.52.F10]|uniref:TMhelix containing protein n=2 Tax=Pariacacavirus TaxID=2948856 RepID=A0A2I7RUK7_9CAUD|nr:TMhelix containing protein [Vibrio phage 1.238.A._10N.261.52.F10]YP_010093531.1 TMhelix containing protein [Vibrio phage 1.245.O._10N.261.54.C7]AUR97337.1 TMhelix containing protein [Vibrio phage 1.238.A._10N.261.52.F10]AUR97431.1 TMhelix containing protein [Vibrio phage 1.238.B._10N.261.52.F10]AUR98001.1 TMhelix containing protein [Vibrio phage 1.245.O._10N.261.54.C7]
MAAVIAGTIGAFATIGGVIYVGVIIYCALTSKEK